mgnify:CR=1 FL=1
MSFDTFLFSQMIRRKMVKTRDATPYKSVVKGKDENKMKREEIKAIFADATDEQVKAVMDLNGADVEKVKSKVTALETELKEKNEDIDKLNTEFEALKTANASCEEWKSKYEALQADIDAKEAQAKADKILAEKTEATNKRFEAALGDKEFNHEAIRADYLKKFGDAIELEENKSKSDADIFRELTENDATAFTGVTAVKLPGGTPKTTTGGEKHVSRAAELAAKYQANLYGVKES